MRQSTTRTQDILKTELIYINKMRSTSMEHRHAKKRKSTKNSLSINSLLLPQHLHHHLEEALLSHLPLSDPSSPKVAGEQRSLKKHSGHPISGPPYKGMILKPDSRPSSLEKRTIALTFCTSRAPLHKPRSASSSRPLAS